MTQYSRLDLIAIKNINSINWTLFFILIGFVIKKLLSEKDIEDMSDYPIQKNDEGTKTIIVDDDISNILNKYQ